MDKLYPLHHHFNSPLFKNPLGKNHTLQTPTALSVSAPSSSLQKLQFLDEKIELKSLNSVKSTHAQMIKISTKLNLDELVRNLITFYMKFGDFRSGMKLFFLGFTKNYQTMNSFIEEFNSFGGNSCEVLEFFRELCDKGVVFDTRILTILLNFFLGINESCLGLEIHACLIKRGFDMDVHLKCALLNFYGKCLDIDSANKLFDEMPNPNYLLWNEAILMNLQNENPIKALQLFHDMQFAFVKASSVLIVKILQSCGKIKSLEEGKQIHGYVIRHELQSNLFLSNSLITMYSKNKKIESSRKVFDSMENYNLASWNSIISAYTSLGYLDDAWNLLRKMEFLNTKPDIITFNCLLSGHFLHGSYTTVLKILRKIQETGFKPNSNSITSVLQAVSELGILNMGKEIHCYMMKNRVDYDVYVVTSLIDTYIKNDSLIYARKVFDTTKNKNIFSWNSLISGYAYKGMFDEALSLLNLMRDRGIKPDLVTWNGLVSGYSMHGYIEEALSIINEIKNSGLIPNVISWTSLISGCSQKENYAGSIKFFTQMIKESVGPNSATVSCVLRAYAGLSMLQKGKEMHCFCIRTGFFEDLYVSTSLIDMYNKSGNLNNSYKVFKKINNKTLASWNCMITGFAIYGLGKKAISLFYELKDTGIDPDDITFTAILSACKNSGLVDLGWKFFDSMNTDYNIIPKTQHFSCMVDLLGKAGYIDEAWDFIQTMPLGLEPDATIWGSVLVSCRNYKNLKFAEIAFEQLLKLEPKNSANYVIMMNLYSIMNRWDDVDRIKDLMDATEVKILQSWSSIEIDRTVHVFSGKNHPHLGEIYFELYQLISEMKSIGYVPNVDCVYQNISNAEKEKVLLSHSEKLAITYGLMKSRATWAPIRVIKSTRVCFDCHEVAKYASLLRQRDIFLKDGVRFHHFRDGKCTCNDCW